MKWISTLILASFLAGLAPAQTAATRISEQEIEQFKQSSPDFTKANSDLNSAWNDVYKNSQCSADWKKNLLQEQRGWVASGRDAEAEKYMSQGMDKSVAYTLATENRARAIRDMAGCKGQQAEKLQQYKGQIFEDTSQGRKRLVLANPMGDGALVLGSYSDFSKETQLCLARALSSRQVITISGVEDTSAEADSGRPDLSFMVPKTVTCVGNPEPAPSREQSVTGQIQPDEAGSSAAAASSAGQARVDTLGPVQFTLPADWKVISQPVNESGVLHAGYAAQDQRSAAVVYVGYTYGKTASQLSQTLAFAFRNKGSLLQEPFQLGNAWLLSFTSQGTEGWCSTKDDGEYYLTACWTGADKSGLQRAESVVRKHLSSQTHPRILP